MVVEVVKSSVVEAVCAESEVLKHENAIKQPSKNFRCMVELFNSVQRTVKEFNGFANDYKTFVEKHYCNDSKFIR